MLRLAPALVLVLCACGCSGRSGNVWQGDAPAKPMMGETRARGTIVLFAPVAIGPLAPIWPEAGATFTADLAERIDVLGRKADADGRFAEALPASDAPAWSQGVVAAARGAHYVVLTRILDVQEVIDPAGTGPGRSASAGALCEMRVLDQHGNVVFQKRGRGDWQGQVSPKFPGPGAKPASQAAWLACSNAVGALLAFLEQRNEAPEAAATVQAGAIVSVEIASDPAGADVLVDGIFRGTTPCTLPLPARPLLLRIERQGRQPWERTITPDAGMRLKPALEPK
jgi:hypothetical protein